MSKQIPLKNLHQKHLDGYQIFGPFINKNEDNCIKVDFGRPFFMISYSKEIVNAVKKVRFSFTKQLYFPERT